MASLTSYFGKMLVAAPTWFTDEYLGIEIEQYIGFGLLAVIITVVHFALLRLIDMFVRRRYADSDLTFWDAERRRLNRGILLLTIGITLLLGFPILDFDTGLGLDMFIVLALHRYYENLYTDNLNIIPKSNNYLLYKFMKQKNMVKS